MTNHWRDHADREEIIRDEDGDVIALRLPLRLRDARSGHHQRREKPMSMYQRHVAYDVDEDEALTPDGVLRSGYSRRVSMAMRDVAAPAGRPVSRRARLHDGAGGRPGHKPGWAMFDGLDDELRRAYREYDAALCDSWRGPASRRPPQPDPLGTGLRDDLRAGRLTIDQAIAEHAANMSEIYAAYDRSVSQMWKRP